MKLSDLKVQSFVTRFDSIKSQTAKGGVTGGPLCNSVDVCETDICHGTRTCPNSTD